MPHCTELERKFLDDLKHMEIGFSNASHKRFMVEFVKKENVQIGLTGFDMNVDLFVVMKDNEEVPF